MNLESLVTCNSKRLCFYLKKNEGVSRQKELLLTVRHCVGAAQQPSAPAATHLAGDRQVSETDHSFIIIIILIILFDITLAVGR